MAKGSGTTKASSSSSPKGLGGNSLKSNLDGFINAASRYSSEERVNALKNLKSDISNINSRNGIVNKIQERLVTLANYGKGGIEGSSYGAVRDFANSYLLQQNKVRFLIM